MRRHNILINFFIMNLLHSSIIQTSCQLQHLNIGKSLVDQFQNMSKSEIESLVKSFDINSESNSKKEQEQGSSLPLNKLIDEVVDKLVQSEAYSNSPAHNNPETGQLRNNPFIYLDEEMLESESIINNYPSSANSRINPLALLLSNNTSFSPHNFSNNTINKKREIENIKSSANHQNHFGHPEQQQHLQQLPLEKLFPQIYTKSNITPMVENNDKIGQAINLLQIVNNQQNNNKEAEQKNNQQLTSALLNHSIHNNYESDEELDRLVFSQLPQGSKLILRTVKIVKTDEDGNEEPIGESAVSWDMMPVNDTDDEDFEDDGSPVTKTSKINTKRIRKRPEYGFVVKDPFEVERIGDAENDNGGEEDEDVEVEDDTTNSSSNNHFTVTSPTISDDFRPQSRTDSNNEEIKQEGNQVNQQIIPDLYSAGSHQTKARSQKYKHGSNEREKEKTDKYFHGKDHSQENINTKTDTDGKKVTDYEGTEKGLTDYMNSHGKAIMDERERYKNSKKKNKGRKVTGFKRVYHKEEFQRTEHFYDDEEAKRIAESYGLTDQKEKSDHGTKQDKRKYHGTKIEHTDVDKLKKEKITKDGHHKGAHHTNEHSDKHKSGQKYSHHSQSQTPTTSYNTNNNHNKHNKYHNNNRNQNNQYQHPNHNYQAAQYSNPASQIGPLVQYAPATLISGFTASSPPFLKQQQHKSYPAYVHNNGRGASGSGVIVAGSQINSNVLPTPLPLLAATSPNEVKIFFAERERKFPALEDESTTKYYAPNFGPPHIYKAEMNLNLNDLDDNSVANSFNNKIGVGNNISFSGEQEARVGGRYANNYINTTTTSRGSDPAPAYYSTIVKMTPPLKKQVKRYPKNQNYNGGDAVGVASDGNGENLLGIQKSKTLLVASQTSYPPPSRPRKHRNRRPGRIFSNGNRYSTWLPIGNEGQDKDSMNAASMNNNENNSNDSSNSTTIEGQVSKNGPANSTSLEKQADNSNAKLRNKHLSQILIAKPLPYRITHPILQRHLAFRPPQSSPVGSISPNQRQQSHYYGTAIINHPPPPPSSLLRRIPSYPQIMNGFVNSMTGVFGRVG